jgi:hypothetical protein
MINNLSYANHLFFSFLQGKVLCFGSLSTVYYIDASAYKNII